MSYVCHWDDEMRFTFRHSCTKMGVQDTVSIYWRLGMGKQMYSIEALGMELSYPPLCTVVYLERYTNGV